VTFLGMDKMEITKEKNCIKVQMPIYFEDVVKLLEEAKNEGLTLNKVISQLKDYIKTNPESPYVKGNL